MVFLFYLIIRKKLNENLQIFFYFIIFQLSEILRKKLFNNLILFLRLF